MLYRKLLSEYKTFDWNKWLDYADIEKISMSTQLQKHLKETFGECLSFEKLIENFNVLSRTVLGNVDEQIEIIYHSSTSGEVISRDVFNYDKDELEKYINIANEFWYKSRHKVGVEVEEVYKCNTCEYKEGCEWRKEQAKKRLENVKKRFKIM